MLAVNDKAPDFKLADQNGNVLSLSDYLGRWLLIYFYPKDFTPGCTKEACSFRDNFSLYKDKLEIVGISGDSVKSHEKFAEKYELPFPLLADPDKKSIKMQAEKPANSHAAKSDTGKKTVTVTLASIAAAMREKFPGLPEDQIVGSEAWMQKVQAEQSAEFKENIKGAGGTVLTLEVGHDK